MTYEPLFSIITVSFNSADTIERTIQSVLSQSFTNYEYIIVDGGSNDKTIPIIQAYEPQFNGKLYWSSEKDNGIYHAMNKGIKKAKGVFVGIVNSDDWLEPNALDIIANCIRNPEYADSIICGWMNFHYINGDIQVLRTNRDRFNSYIKRHLMGLNHPATFVPIEVYKKIGCFDEGLKISADVEFILRAAKNNTKFHFIDKVLTNMRDGGVSNRISMKRYKDRKYLLKKYTNNNFEYYSAILSYVIVMLSKTLTPKEVLYAYRRHNRK